MAATAMCRSFNAPNANDFSTLVSFLFNMTEVDEILVMNGISMKMRNFKTLP